MGPGRIGFALLWGGMRADGAGGVTCIGQWCEAVFELGPDRAQVNAALPKAELVGD